MHYGRRNVPCKGEVWVVREPFDVDFDFDYSHPTPLITAHILLMHSCTHECWFPSHPQVV
jgi:hypothetical protein